MTNEADEKNAYAFDFVVYDRITDELGKLKKAIKGGNKKRIEKLLQTARSKRSAMIKYKIRKKEIIS